MDQHIRRVVFKGKGPARDYSTGYQAAFLVVEELLARKLRFEMTLDNTHGMSFGFGFTDDPDIEPPHGLYASGIFRVSHVPFEICRAALEFLDQE